MIKHVDMGFGLILLIKICKLDFAVRLVIRLMKTLIYALGIFLGLVQILSAQEVKPLWSINCNNQVNEAALICEMKQSIVLADRNQILISVAFVKLARKEETEILLTLPFGLLFSAGLVISVDGTGLGRLDFLTCEAQACYARSPVPKTWMSAMRAGNKMTVEGVNSLGERLLFEFDLTGFTKASNLLP